MRNDELVDVIADAICDPDCDGLCRERAERVVDAVGGAHRVLDVDDEAVYQQAFALAIAADRFLSRPAIADLVTCGLLNAEPVEDLQREAARMRELRERRNRAVNG